MSENLTLGRVNATPEVRETPGCSQIPRNVSAVLGWGDAVGDMARTIQTSPRRFEWGFLGFLMVHARRIISDYLNQQSLLIVS